MRKLAAILLIMTLILLGGCGPKTVVDESGDKVEIVAKVGEETIPLEAFNKSYLIVEKNYKDIYGEDIMTQMVGDKTLMQLIKEQILSNMVLEQLVKQSLMANGTQIDTAQIDDNYDRYYEQELKDNQAKQDFYKQSGIDEDFIKTQLENQLYVSELKNQITEQINEEVAVNEEVFKLNPVKVRARHILVKDKTLAVEILTKLQAGEDFATLANQYTIDPGSKDNGGELDFFTRGAMVKPFEDAAFSMKPGEISGLVESQYGFHIIQVEEVKTLKDLEAEGASADELKVQRDAILKAMVDTAYLKQIDGFKTKIAVETYPEMIK